MPNEATRAYIYRVLLAAGAVAVAAGVVPAEDLDPWLKLALAFLSLGPAALAAANTSTK